MGSECEGCTWLVEPLSWQKLPSNDFVYHFFHCNRAACTGMKTPALPEGGSTVTTGGFNV
jgi:hypothetical protein